MIKLVFRYIKPYIHYVLLVFILLFAQANLDLLLPNFMSDIVNNGIQRGLLETSSRPFNYVLNQGIKMLGVALLSACCAVLVSLISTRTAASVARSIRRDVFFRVESFSNAEFNQFSTASLIIRTTNDITQVQMVIIMAFRIVFYAPILGVGAILNILRSGVDMVWIIALGITVVFSLIVGVYIFVLPKFKVIQSLIDKVNLVARENLTGLLVVRAFSSEKYEQQRFDEANSQLAKTQLFVIRAIVILLPLMNLLTGALGLMVVWFGAKQIDLGNLQIGNMMAFMQYAMQIIISFIFIAAIFVMLPRASVSALRILEVLDTETTIADPPEPLSFIPEKSGHIVFDRVSFKYPNAEDYALKDISFTALPGQTTAIIGSTGSGKSTLVNLIPRLYDVTEGTLYVNGTDVRCVKQSELRAKIGYISQTAVLFTGTIADNLRFGNPNATQADLERAIAIAQAEQLTEEKTNGYDEQVAQGGTNFSGGQKQRLAIARALVKDPDIYIFDDSFSALDFKTDTALRTALKENLNNKTIIIVTQRISTIMDAQQIIVINDGAIVGKGQHKQLLKNCQVYQEIAYSQLSKEELT